MANSTQYLGYPSGSTKYYVNARGQNYLPSMENEWKKSGYLPRSPLFYAASNVFLGSNKTSQWWYYDSEDNERCLQQLRSIGDNCIRVFADIYVWHRNPEKFKAAIKDFHRLCDKYKIRVQWCLWDGIEIVARSGNAPQPVNRAQTVSSLEHGLLMSWHQVPHEFEVSSVAAQADFFTTCATPYLNDFASSVSSYQSLWSFDLKNESDGLGRLALVSSTSIYLSSMLSSLGVGITIGHGSTYDPYPRDVVLTNGIGQGPGGTYLNSRDYITSCAPWTNFASVHLYANTRYNKVRYVNEAVSGAEILGIPGMYNEENLFRYEMDTYRKIRYGGMSFDGLIDRAFSEEPFLNVQGIFYADGTVRNADTVSSYTQTASAANWFSNRQLNFQPIEKTNSTNGGLDGGFWSGVIPEHREFKSDIYVSATELAWTATKSLLYANFPWASKNYPPIYGTPMDEQVFYSTRGEGYTFPDLVRKVLNWEEEFPPLSGMDDGNFVLKNKEICIRNLILKDTTDYLFDFNIYPQLVGSQFDPNPISAFLRYDFSSTSYPLLRAASSVAPLNNNRFATEWSSVTCHTTSSCFYNVGTDISQGLDWEAYDELYNSCFDKLRTCLQIMIDKGEELNKYQFKLLD